MFDLTLIRIFLLVLGSALASYTDLKTGLIYDKITYPMIALGLVFTLISENLAPNLLLGAIVFAVGYFLYFTGKIGGGDVKLFTGITLLMPFFNSKIPFVLSTVFYSGLISVVILSIYYVIKYAGKGIDFKYNQRGMIKSSLLGVAFLVYFIVLSRFAFFPLQSLALLAVPLFFGLIFFALEKGIRKEFFVQRIPLKELEEDEIIAWDFVDSKLKEALDFKGKNILGKKEINKLAEMDLTEIEVYRNLPKFAPFIFFGVLFSLLYPSFLDSFFFLKMNSLF
ncbi:MAG TPA: A24 family peptidase [archaeon]|nr:A24 family peptidase [archaeon]